MSIETIMIGERMKFIKRIKTVNNEIKSIHAALKAISSTNNEARLLSELESLLNELRYLTVNKDSEFIAYLDLRSETKAIAEDWDRELLGDDYLLLQDYDIGNK